MPVEPRADYNPELSVATSDNILTVSKSISSISLGIPITENDGNIDVLAHGVVMKPAGKSNYQRRPKPPYSYIALIAMAIRDSQTGKLTLAEINDYLMKKFPFFRGEYTGWRNSVRHNLSLNECFRKVLRDPNRPWGKDNYWMLNESTDYTFADGVFRRRRKRLHKKSKSNRNSGGSSTLCSAESKSYGRVINNFNPEHKQGRIHNRQSSFLIDDLLGKQFSEEDSITSGKSTTGSNSSAINRCRDAPEGELKSIKCEREDEEDDADDCSSTHTTSATAAKPSKLIDIKSMKEPSVRSLNHQPTIRRHRHHHHQSQLTTHQPHSSSPSRSSSVTSSQALSSSSTGTLQTSSHRQLPHSQKIPCTKSPHNEWMANFNHSPVLPYNPFWPATHYLQPNQGPALAQQYRSGAAAWFPFPPHTFPANLYPFMFPQSAMQTSSSPHCNDITQHLAAIAQTPTHHFPGNLSPERLQCLYSLMGK